MRQAWRPVVATVIVAALGGCSGDRFGSSGTTPASAPPRTAAPPTDMAGRWTFNAGSGACTMNFSAGGASEGAIRPEGGCPGNFYTSRKWTFEGSGLVIRDHNSAALAQLQMSSPSRFDGQATGGQPVSLSR